MLQHIRIPLALLAITLVVGLLLFVLMFLSGFSMTVLTSPKTQTLGEAIRLGKVPPPLLSTTTKEKLEKSTGFQHLISYTDGGFEPTELRIKSGETIRFTNNSSNDLWIAADGSSVQIYPRTMQTCGSSDLDSCEPFSPQDFWEFTFVRAGEWHVINNLDKSKNAMITVQ